LHNGGEIFLSPAYDLLSSEVYPEKDISREIAMTINGKGKYAVVTRKDFNALYEQLGLNPVNTMRLLKNKFARVVKAAESVKDELNNKELSKSGVYDSIIEIISTRAKKLFDSE